jgi:hypothetical protein
MEEIYKRSCTFLPPPERKKKGWALRYVFQCLSEWILQAEQIGQHPVIGKLIQREAFL